MHIRGCSVVYEYNPKVEYYDKLGMPSVNRLQHPVSEDYGIVSINLQAIGYDEVTS